MLVGLRRRLRTWLIKGPWCRSVSSTTSMLVASQAVHQLFSLCFICKCHFARAVGHSRLRVLRSYCSSSPVTPPEACSNGPGMQWLSCLIAYGFHTRHTSERNLYVHNGLSVSLPSSSLLRSSYIKFEVQWPWERKEAEGQVRQNKNVFVWFCLSVHLFFKWWLSTQHMASEMKPPNSMIRLTLKTSGCGH